MQDDKGSDQDRLRARLAELAPDPESYEALTDELALFAGAESDKLHQMQSDIGHSLDEALSDVMLLQQRESLSVEVSTLLERFAVPSFLVRADGRIVSRNESAMQVFETPDNATAIDLPFDLQQAEPLDEMVARVAHLRGGNQPLHLRRGFLRETDRMITLVLLPTQVGADLAPGLLMFVIDPVMHDQAIDLLAQAHGLTDAEKDILKAFGDGKPIKDIAQKRGRSLSTIRTQFQRLLEKTGAGSQAELMRSTQALSNFVHDLGDVVDVASHPTRNRLDILRPEGRSVDVLISGDRTGTPVIFVTGAFLHSFPPVIEAAFCDAGICVLAICRPGFGRTSVVPKGQDRVTCIAQDTQAVLSQLGVSSAPFLVHSSGIPAALDMAHVLGAVMQRIVIIGGMAPLHHMRAHAAKARVWP